MSPPIMFKIMIGRLSEALLKKKLLKCGGKFHQMVKNLIILLLKNFE